MSLILLIIILFAVAAIPAKMAEKKGRSFWHWYIYGCIIWPVATIHAWVMKARNTKICPCCKEEIKEDAVVCKFCHTDLIKYYQEHPWADPKNKETMENLS